MKLDSETDPNWINQKSYIVWQKKPLIVRLTPRARGEAKKGDDLALAKDAEAVPAPTATNPAIELKPEDGIPEAPTETDISIAPDP